MRALVFTRAGQVELLDVPDSSPGPGEVVVDVRSSAICGSELHGFKAVGLRQPPLIMGHEFAGTLQDGRRVVVNPLLTCGTCRACQLGISQVCESRRLVGIHRPGGFAEQACVPQEACVALPADMSWTAAALIEPLANAVHAWSLIPDSPDRVGIMGAGAIGLLSAAVARAAGCASVEVLDPSPRRREVARVFGALPVFELSGEYDAVIDAAGVRDSREQSVARLRAGGTAVWIGLASSDAAFDGNDLVRSEKTVRGSFAYSPDEFREAVELASGLDTSWTTSVGLGEAEATFMALASGGTDITKAVIEFR